MEIKEALLLLKEDAISGNIKKGHCGICHLLSDMDVYGSYRFVKDNCSDWGYFSGDYNYPVSGEEGFDYHMDNGDLWKGEQLELRLSLIDHLLNKC